MAQASSDSTPPPHSLRTQMPGLLPRYNPQTCAQGTQLVQATPHIPLSPREPRHWEPWAESWWGCEQWCPVLCLQVLKCLKQALKPAAQGVSLSWTLPRGLEVEVLGGTPQFIFQGQYSLLYAQIHGQAQVRAGTTVTPSYLPISPSNHLVSPVSSSSFPCVPRIQRWPRGS